VYLTANSAIHLNAGEVVCTQFLSIVPAVCAKPVTASGAVVNTDYVVRKWCRRASQPVMPNEGRLVIDERNSFAGRHRQVCQFATKGIIEQSGCSIGHSFGIPPSQAHVFALNSILVQEIRSRR